MGNRTQQKRYKPPTPKGQVSRRTEVRESMRIQHEMQKGECYYCKRPMRLLGPMSTDLATIEHLYSKMDIRRLLDDRSVLACYDCNHLRGVRENLMIYGTLPEERNQSELLINLLNNKIDKYLGIL
jgi:5-methylcytosine-specific restriction endonuclease McrA